MFEFPRIISLYYIKCQQDATLAVLFTSNCKIFMLFIPVVYVQLMEVWVRQTQLN
jgi:hypothetical protein